VTINAWIYPTALGTKYEPVFVSDDVNGDYYGYFLMVAPTGKVWLTYGDGTGAGSGDRRSKAGTTTLQTNTWYHIVAVIRGAADMDIYINADNDGGTYSRTGGSIAYSTSSASIGRIRFASLDNEFNGKIDDVRVFNAALSEQDAEQLYQNQSPGEVYYYHYDALGSVVALSDSSGDTVQSYQYSAYGQVAASDPNFTANPYLFTGRRFDYETGLYYYRARYYNPYIGWFF
jgi:uncharacterized protein RhaS with RHS repeats